MSVTIFPPLKSFPPLPYCPFTIFTPSSRPVVGGKNCWLDGKPKFLHASRVISPPLVQKKSAPAPCKPFFHYMYCLPGAVRGFQMGWVKISVVVTNATKIFTLPTLGFSKLTYYVIVNSGPLASKTLILLSIEKAQIGKKWSVNTHERVNFCWVWHKKNWNHAPPPSIHLYEYIYIYTRADTGGE